MAVTEERRHQLHQQLDEVVGVDDAATLMELLPPTGWADVARRDDLDRLEESLRAELRHVVAVMDERFVGVDHRFASVDERFEAIDHRFEAIDHRFESMERRFDAVDKRLDAMDKRFGALEQRMIGFERRLENQGSELRTEFRSLMRLALGSTLGAMSLGLAAARFLFS